MKRISDNFLIVLVVGSLTMITLADIAASVIVATNEHRVPQVSGDVAKVGGGAIAGLAAGIAMSIKNKP